MTGSQVSQNSGQPCNSSSGGPLPLRATWKAAPLAGTVKCSIGGCSHSFRRAHQDFSPPTPCLPRHPRLELGPTEGQILLRYGAWRGGRVVECTALEMRHRCKPIGGSNPSLSAKQSSHTSDLTALSKRALRVAPKSVPKACRYAA